MTTRVIPEGVESKSVPKPMIVGERTPAQQRLVYAFLIVPMIALIAAVPLAWGWGLTWLDLGLAAGFYTVACLGVTVGYHRLFTHGSFKPDRWLKIMLAVAGGLGMQGSLIDWVANHRRHHAFADREGDPHSPWLFGTTPKALLKGFWHAHMGWLFNKDRTNHERFAPDLMRDKDLVLVDKLFPLITVVNLLAPAAIGLWATGSWWGALTAFFWAGLVRVAFLHHVTWSTNSVCHMIGERPYEARDKASNFWPLAILSMGESWHNSHHADPTCARHGTLKGQIDISARTIWIFEKLGWTRDVRWPTDRTYSKLTKEAKDRQRHG